MQRVIFLLCVSMILGISELLAGPEPGAKDISVAVSPEHSKNSDFQEYAEFFEKVYETMDTNYYYPITRDAYKKFLYIFDKKIYGQLKKSGKTDNFIKWRSVAHMVDFLKSPDDRFSAFFPPKPAKEFEQTVLGKRMDLGLEGRLTDEGYLLVQVEPRSDAFEKGLREKDLIKAIDKVKVAKLSDEKIAELLNPLEGATVKLKYFDSINKVEKTVGVTTREYFKQTVFMVPVDVPGVFCLQIKRFNQTTSEDLTRFMDYILKQGPSSLIIDLRGNPGGPPLAAREISAFFLPPNEEFAYFQMKNRPKASLSVPEIPVRFRYPGDIVILVNKESGSASELFSGILQSRGRATVMGANTAGQVFLKSMYPFDDESMLLLVTARGHFSDGRVFSFDGVEPNEKVAEDIDLVKYAADYLSSQKKKN